MEHPEEWELIAFFEREPDPVDGEEAEFFGSWSFTMTLDDGDVLEYAVGRTFGDLTVSLRRPGAKEINLAARDVRSIEIERLHGVETLVAVFGAEPDLHRARLTLRPTVRLDWD